MDMKKVRTNVLSAIIIILLMAVCNRLTITEVKYGKAKHQYVAFAEGYTECVIYEKTRLAFTGEIIRDEQFDVCILETAQDCISGKNRRDHIKLGFR